MMVWVTKAEYRGGHRLWLEFNDGLATWPNGADYAPEFLYEQVKAAASEVAEPEPRR